MKTEMFVEQVDKNGLRYLEDSSEDVDWDKITELSVGMDLVLSGLIKTMKAPISAYHRRQFIDLFTETLYVLASTEWQERFQTLVVPGEVYQHVRVLVDGVTQFRN